MKSLLTLLISIFFICNVFAQDKVFVGDTTWINYTQKVYDNIGLKNFLQSNDSFNFRFSNGRQVLEVTQNQDSISGSLINYIYRIKKLNREILFQEAPLDTLKINLLLKNLNTLNIENIPSDENIENWRSGSDGTTYTFEFSDKKKYLFKKYWSPFSANKNKNIPEAKPIVSIIEEINELFNLEESYTSYRNSLPRRFCYSNGMTTMCYVRNTLSMGYLGTSKLPYGYTARFVLPDFGKLELHAGIILNHKFDAFSNYDISAQIQKSYIFTKEGNEINDSFGYVIRKRKLRFLSEEDFLNNKFTYYISPIKTFYFGVGVDHLTSKETELAPIFSVNKYFKATKLECLVETSLFNNYVDSRILIARNINFNQDFFLNSINLGLFFESFQGYEDLGINVTIPVITY